MKTIKLLLCLPLIFLLIGCGENYSMGSTMTRDGFYVLNNQTGQVKVCVSKSGGKGIKSFTITCSKAFYTH